MFFCPPGNAFPPLLPPDKSRILQSHPAIPTPLWKDKQHRKALLWSCQPGLFMAQRKWSTCVINPSQSSLLTPPEEEELREWKAGARGRSSGGFAGSTEPHPTAPHTEKPWLPTNQEQNLKAKQLPFRDWSHHPHNSLSSPTSNFPGDAAAISPGKSV